MLRGRYHFMKMPPGASFGQECVGSIEVLGPAGPDGTLLLACGTAATVGQRVCTVPGRTIPFAQGSFADSESYPLRSLVACPAGVADAEGCAIWMAAITMVGALKTAGLDSETAKGKTVLITAASSGMGSFACQVAKAWGATVLGTTRSAAKAARLEELNIVDKAIVVPSAGDLAKLVKEHASAGFDVAVDAVGYDYAAGLFDCAASGAHIVWIETDPFQQKNAAPLDLSLILRKALHLHGFTIFEPQRNPALFAFVLKETGRLVESEGVRPLVHATYPLEDLALGFEALEKSEHVGKLVVVVAKP